MHLTLQDVKSLPASEIQEWRAFFAIYPFTQEREDTRAAMLASVISNMSGKVLKKPIEEEFFLRDYLEEEKKPSVIKEYSLEEQRARFLAFKEKVRSVKPEWVHDKDKQ